MERALNGVEVPHLHGGEVVHTSRKFDERLTIALLMMRDRFRSQRAPPYHPASAYGSADFGALLERVEHGPQTWDEEQRAERSAYYAEKAAQNAQEFADEEEDLVQDWEGGEDSEDPHHTA